MSETLTPEWLMDEAERLTRYDCDHKLASACRLAARALKAREYLERLRAYGCDVREPGCDGGCGMENIGVMLAILDGREP